MFTVSNFYLTAAGRPVSAALYCCVLCCPTMWRTVGCVECSDSERMNTLRAAVKKKSREREGQATYRGVFRRPSPVAETVGRAVGLANRPRSSVHAYSIAFTIPSTTSPTRALKIERRYNLSLQGFLNDIYIDLAVI